MDLSLYVAMLTFQRLINEKRHAIQTAHSEGLEKADDIGKDLLSILSTCASVQRLPKLNHSPSEHGDRPSSRSANVG